MITINAMIDAAMKCVKCGAAGLARCDCWIRLRCPNCDKSQFTERLPDDASNEVVEPCPQCMERVK